MRPDVRSVSWDRFILNLFWILSFYWDSKSESKWARLIWSFRVSESARIKIISEKQSRPWIESTGFKRTDRWSSLNMLFAAQSDDLRNQAHAVKTLLRSRWLPSKWLPYLLYSQIAVTDFRIGFQWKLSIELFLMQTFHDGNSIE